MAFELGARRSRGVPGGIWHGTEDSTGASKPTVATRRPRSGAAPEFDPPNKKQEQFKSLFLYKKALKRQRDAAKGAE